MSPKCAALSQVRIRIEVYIRKYIQHIPLMNKCMYIIHLPKKYHMVWCTENIPYLKTGNIYVSSVIDENGEQWTVNCYIACNTLTLTGSRQWSSCPNMWFCPQCQFMPNWDSVTLFPLCTFWDIFVSVIVPADSSPPLFLDYIIGRGGRLL